jgi:acyl-CoA thioester hydrolase
MLEHRMTVRVIYGDTDKANVVYYANYLRYFEMGRTELLRENGLTYKQLEEETGAILAVAEAKLRYRASAHYDDLLTIETRITEHDKVSLLFSTRILREEQLLVEGTCKLAAVTPEGKLSRLPAELVSLLPEA